MLKRLLQMIFRRSFTQRSENLLKTFNTVQNGLNSLNEEIVEKRKENELQLQAIRKSEEELAKLFTKNATIAKNIAKLSEA